MKFPKLYATDIEKKSIDLTLSENPLGCSPRVIQRLLSLKKEDISSYPDSRKLMQCLERKFNVKDSQIVLGSGTEQLIKLVIQTFISKNSLVCIQRGSFPLFLRESLIAKANTILINPLSPGSNKKPTIIILCSPNNPTGIELPTKLIISICKRFPKAIILLDEANADFSEITNIPRIRSQNNLIILRTLSKAFGLAGLRVGFAIGSTSLIQKIKKNQQPFPITNPSVEAAIAALEDINFLNKTKNFITKERNRVRNKICALGLKVSESVTNTLFISSPISKRIIRELSKQNVSVVPSSFFPGLKTPGFRIALRDVQTNSRFLTILKQTMACLDNKNLVR